MSMNRLPFRLRRAPVRLDAPGDNWPVYPLPAPGGGWKVARLLSSLFLLRGRRGRRRESQVR
jgi:hypothetical protein